MKEPFILCILCGVTSLIVKKNSEVNQNALKLDDSAFVEDSRGNRLPPNLPRLVFDEKAASSRNSGQNPTRHRRIRSLSRARKTKRELSLAPWRITDVVRRQNPTTTKKVVRPAVTLPVDVCPEKFDAITRGYNGRTYAFAGERVYQMWYDNDLPQKASYLITELFPDGPRFVSAALTNSRSGVTTLISHRTAYRFRWSRKHERFHASFNYHGAKALARHNTPQELPQNITITPQTAFEWMDGNQILLSDNKFVIYDAYWNMATFSGLTKRYFPKLPRDLLGIIYSGGNTMLMYTKRNTVKVYNVRKYRVLQEYPLKVSEYFGCLR
ncbi:hypothetical protein DICVIV_04317 [Dictyocaulus viviparus]|uniref:Hemopexin n=1 Tax=Dictyocaulus viviparus TaxID=29172 RepID=A0A0D8Y0G7_DICVI|nr:hypothetical protein DICVIV_04317 [Dictyocaulus viviparus]